MATIIPFAEAAARIRANRSNTFMINWNLVTPRNIIVIGAIAILAHLLLKPLLARIDLTAPSSSAAAQ
jgi:hypothetical protein